MSIAAQKAFFTSLAQFARSTADLLDEMAAEATVEKPTKAAEPAKAKAKPTEPAKPKEEPKVEPKPAEPVKAAEPAKTNGADDIQTQCRKAAKAYAEVYGREGLKEVLKKYTEGTMADVPPEKLADLLKDLG